MGFKCDISITKLYSHILKTSAKEQKSIFLWKTDHELLLDNFLLGKYRLVSLVNHIKKDPVVLKTYDNIIISEETEGIIEEPLTILNPPGEVQYLPYQPRYSTREMYN